MNLFHRSVRFVALAITLLALATGAALAQKKKEVNEFPNATRKEPKSTPISESGSKKINAAYDALEEGDMEKAEATLNEVLGGKRTSDYEKALVYQGLAQVAYDRDDIDTALDFNQKAIALNSLDNKSHFNLIYQIAQLNLMDERYEPALAAIEQWFQVSGAKEKAEAWSLKGNALYRMDKFNEAAEAMKQAIALSPKPSESWIQMLVASYYDAENFPAAAQAAEEILAKDPTNKKVMQQLSSIYLEMEQNDKAIALLENAKGKGMLTDEKDLKQLYQLYNFVERPADAVRIINEGLASGVLKPGEDIYKSMADAYALQAESQPDDSAERKNFLAKAADSYGQAAKLHSKDGEIDMSQGHLLVEIENWPAAKAAMTEALRKGNLKRQGEAYVLLGTAELELGNESAAIAAYEKARAFPNTKGMAEAWLRSVKQR